MRTLADLDAMRSAQGSAVASRYHFVSYEDLATNTLETVAAVHAFMGVEYVDSFVEDTAWRDGASGSIRAASSVEHIRRAIAAHFPEDGADVGAGFFRGKRTSYSTARAQVECGPCDARVEAQTNAVDACREVVLRLRLRCCSST